MSKPKLVVTKIGAGFHQTWLNVAHFYIMKMPHIRGGNKWVATSDKVPTSFYGKSVKHVTEQMQQLVYPQQ